MSDLFETQYIYCIQVGLGKVRFYFLENREWTMWKGLFGWQVQGAFDFKGQVKRVGKESYLESLTILDKHFF